MRSGTIAIFLILISLTLDIHFERFSSGLNKQARFSRILIS